MGAALALVSYMQFCIVECAKSTLVSVEPATLQILTERIKCRAKKNQSKTLLLGKLIFIIHDQTASATPLLWKILTAEMV